MAAKLENEYGVMAKGPEMRRPNGIAKDAALVSNEKTLPKYSGLIVS